MISADHPERLNDEEWNLLHAIRELPEARQGDGLRAVLLALKTFSASAPCPEMQADGVPCPDAHADCAECRLAASLCAEISALAGGRS